MFVVGNQAAVDTWGDYCSERPDKATRLRITAKPVSDTKVWIQIRDLGFGELFKSSDKVWDYRMEFSEENP